ncbi:cation diffusion facilitator family transporter [Stenotrophomonas rhizophila]
MSASNVSLSHHEAAVDGIAEVHATDGIRKATALTVVVMLAEVIAGWTLNSMALMADGWHMSSHVLVLGLALYTDAVSRRHHDNLSFRSGTWKIKALGGYTSGLLMLVLAASMLIESIERLATPADIHYPAAIFMSIIGLLANIACARWLHDGHDRSSAGSPDCVAHGHRHGADLNLRAAYLHVVTDAATSVLAVAALVAGWHWGAPWLDAVAGILGAGLVSVWAWRLLRSSGKRLLFEE